MKSFIKTFQSILLVICFTSYSQFTIPFTMKYEDYKYTPNSLINLRYLNGISGKIIKNFISYYIQIALGNPGQISTVKLSSLFQGICIATKDNHKDGFDQSISSSNKLLLPYITNRQGTGSIVSDTLQIQSLGLSIDNFPFFLMNYPFYSVNRFVGFLGLAYKQEEDTSENLKGTFDFFNYLPHINTQYRRLIGFKTVDALNGYMLMGQLPDEIGLNPKHYKACSVVVNEFEKHNWSCKVDAVYFDDYDFYKADVLINIILGGNIIGISQKLYLIMRDKYFKEEFANNTCFFDELDEHSYPLFIQIICKRNYNIDKEGTISLVFGKWTLKLQFRKLFNLIDEMYYFAIMGHSGKDKNWFISPSVLTNYYVFFDKDNNHIGFYHSLE